MRYWGLSPDLVSASRIVLAMRKGQRWDIVRMRSTWATSVRRADFARSPNLSPKEKRLQTMIFPLARMRNSTQNPWLGLCIELTLGSQVGETSPSAAIRLAIAHFRWLTLPKHRSPLGSHRKRYPIAVCSKWAIASGLATSKALWRQSPGWAKCGAWTWVNLVGR